MTDAMVWAAQSNSLKMVKLILKLTREPVTLTHIHEASRYPENTQIVKYLAKKMQ